MTLIIQINDEIREATNEETAVIELQRQAAAAHEAEQAAQLLAKESARAKLAALGLTNQEIAALVP
jgi:DNA-binding NarL/FixJ family response regulator